MTSLRRGLRQYLTLRSRLGFVLKDVPWALNQFVQFLESEGASHITGTSIRSLVQRAGPSHGGTASRTSPIPVPSPASLYLQ